MTCRKCLERFRLLDAYGQDPTELRNRRVVRMKAADVIFDPPHFSGGNTSFEAFQMAKPVVAHDGNFMRGRVTAGMYRAMGIEDATGQSLGECAEIALSLGRDEDCRKDMEARITDAREVLFEQEPAAREFERFLIDVFEQTRR